MKGENMKKHLLYIIAISLISLLTSCSDFLDKEYDASKSEEQTFNNDNLTRGFLANIYTNLPDGFNGYTDGQFRGASADCMTDNATSWWVPHYYNNILTDAFTAVNHPLLGPWNSNLAAIRKCNQFLKNAKPSVVGNVEKNGDDNRLYDRYCAETKLLRAIFHFQIIGWFGDTPIIGEDENGVPIIFELSNTEAMNMSRTKAADALKWVADECDKIKNQLPFRYSDETNNWGRVNGATAYALKSRALLYRASELNNRDNDLTYWKEAAQAAKDFITENAKQSKPYKLYQTGKPENDYYQCFITNPVFNEEFILCRSIWKTRVIEDFCSPVGYAGIQDVHGRTNPTQNFVDCFEMSDGKRIDDSGSNYDPQNPYANRDPRLDQIILHHGSMWGDKEQEEYRAVDVHYSNGSGGQGIDYSALHGGTNTGYYLKKFVNNISWKVPVDHDHAWVIFRYGEILLNAAEAINEAEGPDAAYKYVNEVRARAGMPPYAGMSKDEFRERIRNERRIELSFEDHRFFDERRWMLFEKQTSQSEKKLPMYKQIYNIYAARVSGEADSPIYEYTTEPVHPTRTFNSPKNYYFPIPDADIKKAPNLKQNLGWELTETNDTENRGDSEITE